MEGTKRKRKSFIDFNRTSQILFDDNDEDQAQPKGKPKMTMPSYLKSLKDERMQWKEILKARQAELKQSKNCCNSRKKVMMKEVEQFLDKQDQEFLNHRPNYLSLMEDAQKLLKAVKFIKLYKSDVIQFYNNITDELESETSFLVDYLLQKNMCELCNQVNCTNASHTFPTD